MNSGESTSNFCLPLLPRQRVLSHQDDTALLKAYIVEWRKFFTQCDILPKPFCQLEITLMGKQGSNKKTNMEDSIVRKVEKKQKLSDRIFGDGTTHFHQCSRSRDVCFSGESEPVVAETKIEPITDIISINTLNRNLK